MTDEEEVMQLVHGRVKWFDPSKGFGFIVSDQTDADILLHANVLRNFGQGSVADGAGIEVRTEGALLPFGEDAAHLVSADILALDLEPARVKWFDKGKGFGFANVYGRPEDVFVHAEVLRVSGFADLTAGEAVALRIIDGKRGRMAVQVLSWEAATREKAQ
ncbi:MAG: cold-shock protein [Rhodobacterales bacterium 32-66-9]|nr:MAG: cold-shock protein [Rhodobacterales bacterium 32-66-9]